MSRHESTIRRLFEGVWNGEDPDVASELVHEGYLIHDREVAEELRGPALYRALASATRRVFPDAAFAIEDVVEDGDEVALRWAMTGTHERSIADEEPTGKQVELSAVEIDRFENGQLVETWTQSDQLGLFEQVGLLDGGFDGE